MTMRSGFSGLMGLALLTTACGGAKPSVHDPGPAPGAAASGGESCQRVRPGTGTVRIDEARQGATVALVRSGTSTIAYVADEDDDLLHTIDVDTGTERAVTPLAGSPSQLLVLAD